jgi:hypothetical protein
MMISTIVRFDGAALQDRARERVKKDPKRRIGGEEK